MAVIGYLVGVVSAFVLGIWVERQLCSKDIGDLKIYREDDNEYMFLALYKGNGNIKKRKHVTLRVLDRT